MKKVRAKHPFQHHGRVVKTGDVLEVEDHEANNLVTGGHADAHDEAAGKSGGDSSWPSAGTSNKPGGSGGGAGNPGNPGSGPA